MWQDFVDPMVCILTFSMIERKKCVPLFEIESVEKNDDDEYAEKEKN